MFKKIRNISKKLSLKEKEFPMRKTVLTLTIGMVITCALTMLTVVNAADQKSEDEFSLGTPQENSNVNSLDDFSLELDITEDVSDSNKTEPLPVQNAPKTAEPKTKPAPEKELSLAQNTAPAPAPESNVMDAAANVSNILAAPDLAPPKVTAPANVPAASAPVKTAAEPVIPTLPPVEQSIVKSGANAETLPPATTIDPIVEMSTPNSQPQPIAGAPLQARGPAYNMGGSCPNCPGAGFGRNPELLRPVYYGVQRNGVPAYPRAGNCCGCGGRGCPGCCGHRYPMEYPYYTLRGPRDFDDPNPRPIGP